MYWSANLFTKHFLVPCMLLILIVNVEAFNEYEDIQFELYTREYPDSWQVLNTSRGDELLQSSWRAERPTRCFVHGFKSKRKVLNRYAKAFLHSGDYNFIAVNWMEGSSTSNYYVARNRVKKVARMFSGFIDYLVSYGMNLQDLLVVGHSLGAHISGIAGKQLQSPGKIGVIIGLDPAGPLFPFNNIHKRLADTDADYVQVIHTDAGYLGIKNPIGHGDFYPNGGRRHPGCEPGNALTGYLKKCSHSKAHVFYLESVMGHKYPSVQCISFEEIEEGECSVVNRGETFLMGGDLTRNSPKPKGVFYLETNDADEAPHSISNVDEFKDIGFVYYS